MNYSGRRRLPRVMLSLMVRRCKVRKACLIILVCILFGANILPSQAHPQAQSAGSDTDQKADELVLVGTVTKLHPIAAPRSLRRWAVVMRVEKVMSGKFSGATFTFTVHSPANAGLQVNQTYTVKATRAGEGYLVNERDITKAQTVNRTTVSEETESLKRMLANQPDHTARQKFFFSEGFGGFGADSKVAKLGNRRVEVTEDTIFINEPSKPTIKVYPQRKEYSEMPALKNSKFADSPEELVKRDDVLFKTLGTERVGKYSCIKIEVKYKDEKLKDVQFLYWSSPELKNLIIKSEITLGQSVKFLTLLEDVSFSVDEELFRIPADYKKVVEPDYMKELQEKLQKPR